MRTTVMPMTPWWLQVILLATVAHAAAADNDVLYKVVEKLSEDKRGCELPENVHVDTHCKPMRLGEIRRLPARHVPSGAVCTFDKEDNFTYTCTEKGIWVEGVKSTALSSIRRSHRRHKRWIMALIIAGGPDLLKNLGLMKKLLCMVLCKKRPRRRVPPLMPPRITCPVVSSPQHPLAGKSLKVTWEKPFASDRLDGPIDAQLMKGKPPGSDFEEGKHFVYYKAKNSKGLTAYCTFNFTVEVSRCERPKWPWNAQMKCDDEQVSGSVCSFTCKIGFKVEGDKQIMCLRQKWVGTIPKCVPVTCPPPPKVDNAVMECPGKKYAYASTCVMKCNRGFLTEGTAMILCNSTGTWTSPGSCRDLKTPKFPNGCVEDQHALAGPRDEPAVVTWEKPNVTDNSETEVTITYSHEPGSRFPLGRTTVVVKAEDKSQNAIKCSFAVFVEAERCKDPAEGNTLNNDLLIYDCPNGTSLGYSCKVSCKADYPLIGASTVTCSKESGKLRWTREKGKTKPYCKSTDCPKLREPINGAITCDKWDHGRFCSMHCNAKYDVPRRVPTPWYVCGMSTGRWRPHGIVQDCIVRRRPDRMRLPAEMYYHAGSCPKGPAMKEMSKNFINMLRKSPLFAEECGERVPNCKPEMVDVRCGDIRSKRDVASARGHNHIYRRSAKKSVVLEFDIQVPFQDLSLNGSESVVLYKKMFKDITSSIETLVKTGSLAMDGYELTNSSFAPGVATIDCPKGTQPRPETGSCAGCPTGTFYNEISDDCDGCAKGFYQDEAYSTTCKPCPEGKSTALNGSRSETNCTDMCPSGFYSKYGIIPCVPCAIGTYQDRPGQSSCNRCPPGLTTVDMGVNTSTECIAYDLKIMPTENVSLGEINATQKSVSLYTWLRLDEGVTEATLFEFVNAESSLAAKWKTNKVTVTIGSTDFEATGELGSEKWYHVILIMDTASLTVKLYIDGKSVISKTTSDFPSLKTTIILNSAVKTSALTYSGLNAVDRLLIESDIAAMSSTCNRTISDSIFNPDTTLGKMISPSQCDAYDDCISRPCGDSECVNEVDGYKCICAEGYKGVNCEIPPDPCLHNMCQNDAMCVSNTVNYTCKCRDGFSGNLCGHAIVNGKWSPWTEWSLCTRVCGSGTRRRNRKCDNPPPEPDGQPCEGSSTQEEPCNIDPCRVCPPLKRSYGVVTSCDTTDDLTQCTIRCRGDMVFAEEPLPVYECGEKTDYHWNHQTDADPDGRLPACTAVRSAKAYSMKRTLTLPTLPCTPDGKSDKSVTSQVASQSSDIACVKQKVCKPVVDVRKCPGGRGKRGAGTSVSMTISTTIGKDASLDLGKLLNNNTMTIGMKNYLRSMLMFEQSAQEVVNNSAKVFSVTINGVKYAADVKSATTDVNVECKSGEVETEGACSKCPAGAREESGSCVLCKKGTYQDKTGATSCTRCAQGKTTLDVGAQSHDKCIIIAGDPGNQAVDADSDQVSTQESPVVEEKTGSDHTLIIVLSVMITAMVISITAAAIIWIVKMKKLPHGSVSWGESGRNKINPGTEGENPPPPYPAVYVPPPPPPYTPMDALNPGTTNVRPNTASDVQLRVMTGANTPNMSIKGIPAATQTSLGPTPSTTPISSRNHSPNRRTPSPSPSPSHSRGSSRSASPARNLASTVNSRSNSPVRINPMTDKTSPGMATIETRNLPKGATVTGSKQHGTATPPTRTHHLHGPGTPSTRAHQNRSPSPQRQLRTPPRSPSPARSLADAVGVSKNHDVTPPPPAAIYTAPELQSDAPPLTPVRKINTGDPFPRSRSPSSFISSS